MTNSKLQAFLNNNFDIANYSDAKHLSAVQWFNQFLRRKHLDESIRTEHNVGFPKNGDELPTLLQNPLNKTETGQLIDNPPIMKVPIEDWVMHDYLVAQNRLAINPSLLERLKAEHAAAPEYWCDWNTFPSAIQRERLGPELDLSTVYFDHVLPAADEPNDDLERMYIADIKVDLSCTDNHIKKEFNAWLHTKRSLMQPKPDYRKPGKKGFTKHDLDSWSKYEILAYIDLELTALYYQEKMSLREISIRLWPDDDHQFGDKDMEDHIRKTVKPLAEYLRSDLALNILQSNIQEQYDKRKKGDYQETK